MTEFANKSFSVSQRGRDPTTCSHGWLRAVRGRLTCVLCGLPVTELWMQEQEDYALKRATEAT